MKRKVEGYILHGIKSTILKSTETRTFTWLLRIIVLGREKREAIEDTGIFSLLYGNLIYKKVSLPVDRETYAHELIVLGQLLPHCMKDSLLRGLEKSKLICKKKTKHFRGEYRKILI